MHQPAPYTQQRSSRTDNLHGNQAIGLRHETEGDPRRVGQQEKDKAVSRPTVVESQQQRTSRPAGPSAVPSLPEGETLLIQDRGRTERLPLAEVLYFKAEQKYVTVRTTTRSYIMDGSLSELETKFAPRFLRIHRNALVARRAVRALEKHYDPEEGEGWAVRLQGSTELLAVSRRQVAAVREELAR